MNGKKTIKFAVAILLLACIAPNHGIAQTQAQQQSKGTDKDVPVESMTVEQAGERADALIRKIELQIEDEKRYLDQVKNASKEDQQVLDLQLFKLRQAYTKEVLELIDLLLILEQKAPQPQLRDKAVQFIHHVSPLLKNAIKRLRDKIDERRALRPKAKTEALHGIEQEVAKYTTRLDDVFNDSLLYLQKMAQVGLDTQGEQAHLTKHCYDRADELSGRIALALVRIDDLEAQRKQFPEDADIAKRLAAALKGLDTNTSSLEKLLVVMDQLQLETEAFRGDLVLATRDLSAGLTDTGVALQLASRTLAQINAWLMDNGLKYVFKLLVVVGIIFIFRFASRLVRSGIDKALEKAKMNFSQLAHNLIVNTSSKLVMFFGVLIALSQLGIELAPLLAGLGVAGFIVGFALQDSLGNFASGLMILLYQPYDVGSLIEVGGVSGTVDRMNLVSTSLKTVDNQLIVIPNNKIWGDVIKNITAQKMRRVDMVFGISYTDDIPQAETILMDILKAHERVLDDPEPMVRVHTLGASSVDFIVRPWVKSDDYWEVYWDVTRTVKLRFDEEGISIPFPQQDVHIQTIPKTLEPAMANAKAQ